MSKRLRKSVRVTVAGRARYRCEYCHASAMLALGHFHADHIQPIKRGGTDELANLAYACPLCNEKKLLATEARDPLTGQMVRLFNPRIDDWNMHFLWNGVELDMIGLTPIGRATISVLRMNDAKRRYLRSLWKTLNLHPPAGDRVAEE